ncbi:MULTISPECIES: hypothetical protein [unclassified Actinomyces]|uniref:hypothetical protein n=1 Tax=unclassified Actinomyces TaxID=2609248 RepID=UPI000D59AC1A|nr:MULTISPECIES: hypothetical protein [unclassified Actinomyces]RAX24184.1 hypothetical protein DRB07_01835 [Actinomyces sp. Z3]
MSEKERLAELKEYVDRKNREIGLVNPYACTIVEGLYGWVNASDTWEGPLADEESEYTKGEIDALIAVFVGLSDDLATAIANAESGEESD